MGRLLPAGEDPVSQIPDPADTNPRGTLVYDGACGFCSSVARLARRRLPKGTRIVPYQKADLESLGLTKEEAAETAWWIEPDGTRRPGHEAVAGAMEAMGGVWELAGRTIDLPVVKPVSAAVYDLVSRNRGRFAGGPPDVPES
jgi:predicted DCC family thiol-disulfide oxidoreductase YuxK